MMTIQLLFLIPLFAIDYGATMTLDPRIVAGRLAEPGEIPYQVSLQDIRTEHHFCGGVIINPLYILTAAHCVNGIDIRNVSVNVGLIDLQKPHAVHLIESAYIHENYDPLDSWINDIALLKLQSPLVFSSLVSSVNLAANENIEPGSVAVVSGYGLLSFRGKRTKQLYVAEVNIADQAYCKKMYSNYNIYDTQICAYDPTTEKGSCQGDSGGPLTVNGKLIGLVSWSHGCASTIYPSVFTRVPSYVAWIIKHILYDLIFN